MLYALVLAGGSGTRLWPYSRVELPKQFLSIGGDLSMLQATVARTLPIIPHERIFIATGDAYVRLVEEQLPELPPENILVEPAAKGTGPCVAWAALQMHRRCSEAVMAVLSADHRIMQHNVYLDALTVGKQVAEQGFLVALGLPARQAHPGYGYIKRGNELYRQHTLSAYDIAGFIEKPNAALASSLVATGQYVWNAGIFVWTAERILRELAQVRPALLSAVQAVDMLINRRRHEAHNCVQDIWSSIQHISIDVAVMEQTKHGAVLPCDLGRQDIGDWASLYSALAHDRNGNVIVGDHVAQDTTDCLVLGTHRPITTIGLEDMVVVDTSDALLVCRRDCAQEVKELVRQLHHQHKHVV